MAKNDTIDYGRTSIKAKSFVGDVTGAVAWADVTGGDAGAQNAIKTKTEVAALVSPTVDYADLEAATAAIKSIIDALKA